jgi:hypothetical protein
MENYCDETIPKILVGNKDDNNKVSGIRIEKKPNNRKCYKQEALYRIKYKI